METVPFKCADQNALEEEEVQSQHCKEYDCSKRCAREKAIAAIYIISKDEERLRLEE